MLIKELTQTSETININQINITLNQLLKMILIITTFNKDQFQISTQLTLGINYRTAHFSCFDIFQ